jgi:uncharacterized protein YjbJ (UPF0337 family)
MFGNAIGHQEPSPGADRCCSALETGRSHAPIRSQEIEIMGELTDKIKGNLDEAAGKIKQHSDDPETRDEGAAQELKGKGEQFAGKVKGALGDDI